MSGKPPGLATVRGARCLALFGDSITTDHISPAGAIKKDSPAGQYLQKNGVAPADFNSYGSRRGNHEVMMRGTFANTRIKNHMVPGVEGGVTCYQPDGGKMPIYDAAMKYVAAGVPLIVIAGKEYGTGSSRDWAAKGTSLLGVRAVIAESFERIHRANLVGMGVFPLTFQDGQTARSSVSRYRGLRLRGTHRRQPRGDRAVDQPLRDGDALQGQFRVDRRRNGIHGQRRHPALRPAPARGLSAAAMRVAVFDLDGTITRHDTFLPYLRGWLRRHPRPGFLVHALAALLRFPFGGDRGRLKSDLIRAGMAGATRGEVRAWTAEYVAGLGEREFCPRSLATIALHRTAGIGSCCSRQASISMFRTSGAAWISTTRSAPKSPGAMDASMARW